MGRELGFLWQATRGHRLAPWRSPYLAWRIETYWGRQAGLHKDGPGQAMPPGDFARFVWHHRGELFRFVRWAGRMRGA